MKRLSAILMIVLALGTFSCKKLRHVNFDADFKVAATMQAQQNANTTTEVQGEDITTNIATLVKDNNTRTDLLRSVKLKNLTCEITAPSGQTFSFLDDVRILIATDRQNEREVAVKHNVSNNSNTLELDVSDIDLKEFFISDVIKVKAIIVNKEAINTNISLNLKIKVHFEADLLAAAGL